ncbi:hypothetical protein CaCOL14_000639 [Colletotrichum acutatum]
MEAIEARKREVDITSCYSMQLAGHPQRSNYDEYHSIYTPSRPFPSPARRRPSRSTGQVKLAGWWSGIKVSNNSPYYMPTRRQAPRSIPSMSTKRCSPQCSTREVNSFSVFFLLPPSYLHL